MTQWLAPTRSIPRDPAAARQAAGRVHGARLQGERTFLDPVLAPVERVIYRVAGVTPKRDGLESLRARHAAVQPAGLGAVYVLQRLQGFLPLNPQGFGAVSPDSSFNTAVSFATNTNWQSYGGETTMSYLTQMLGLTVQNFVSAAAGHGGAGGADPRAWRATTATTMGNFWVDLTRSTLYILLPLSLAAGAGAGLAGCGADLRSVPDRDAVQPTTDADGKRSRSRLLAAGPGGLADRHQAAGHQRRRLLQRQLGASVREPDAALQFPGDAGHPADPGGAVLHLRQDGRRYAPGLGDPGGDDDHLRR